MQKNGDVEVNLKTERDQISKERIFIRKEKTNGSMVAFKRTKKIRVGEWTPSILKFEMEVTKCALGRIGVK